MRPTIALVTAGVEMDVLGLAYQDFSDAHRHHVCEHHPRGDQFKEGIIDAFAAGTIKKPLTTFGNVKADVLADKDPSYRRLNFCSSSAARPGRAERVGAWRGGASRRNRRASCRLPNARGRPDW